MIAEFARRYPGISFEFDLTPRRVDLVAEPVDVAIRMGELPNSHLIARQLARLPRSCAPFLQHTEERSAAKETKTYIPQIMW